jgi:hypothetical protein
VFNGDVKFVILAQDLGLKKRKSQTEVWKCEQSGLHLFQYYCEWYRQGLCFGGREGDKQGSILKLAPTRLTLNSPLIAFPCRRFPWSRWPQFALECLPTVAILQAVARELSHFVASMNLAQSELLAMGWTTAIRIPVAARFCSWLLHRERLRNLLIFQGFFSGVMGDKTAGTWNWPQTL